MCLVICALLALPATALATPTWLAPAALSQTGQDAQFTDAAMGSGGGAAVVWSRSNGTYLIAQAATRAPFGSFGPAVNVSPPAQDAIFAQVAEDVVGDATVVWENATGSPTVVEVSTIVAGVPSTPAKLSATSQNAVYPSVAMNDRGDTIVTWLGSDGSHEIAQASFRPAGGSFGTPVMLSAAGQNASFPRAAIDAAGDATVVWYRSNGSNEIVEQATRSAATGSFSAAQPLSAALQSASYATVAMDAAGDTAVAWSRSNGSNLIAQAVVRPAGGSFGPVAELSEAGADAVFPRIALDGRGDPTVVWMRNSAIQISSGTVSGAFSSPLNLGYPYIFPVLAEDPAGDVLVGFYNALEPNAAAVFRPAGEGFGLAKTVSPAGQPLVISPVGSELGFNVGIDASGDGLFGFATHAANNIGGEALLDAAGPALNGLSIPASATAGTPVTFSVAPAEQISTVAGTSWSFGDASTVSGTSVSHTFSTPGTYTVSVTATDANGNSTTQTGKIAVAAASPPAPPAFAGSGLSTSSVTLDSHGRVKLKVSCPGASPCSGVLTLTLPAKANALAASAKPNWTRVTLFIGRTSFSATAGGSATVTLTLPASVRRLIAQHKRLTLTTTLDSHDGLGQTSSKSAKLVVKAAPKKKKPKKKH
jgi:hypothetical protein